MDLVFRTRLVFAAIACGLLCAGCAGVVQLDPDQQMAMTAAQRAADLSAAATETASSMHAQAVADAQRAADAMAQLAAQAAAQATPPMPPIE